MKTPNLRNFKKGPERIIQDALIKYLEGKGWFIIETHGSLYQSGLPDLYCTHEKHKQRWIEVKNLDNYTFTPAQRKKFPLISKGAGIWILTAATDSEYQKLFEPPNWWTFL